MPATYQLIASNTLSSSAASVTFSAIPATYTDLVLRYTARSDESGTTNANYMIVNSETGNVYSDTYLYGYGSTTTSGRNTNTSNRAFLSYIGVDSGATSNTFSSVELYFPNYNSTTNKPVSLFGVSENNSSTTNVVNISAILLRITSGVTTINIAPPSANNFVSGSSFFLYGIKNS